MKKGFTLLELLIVLIIIGVLAALFIPSFRPAKEAALNDEARANLDLIKAAEKVYRMENNLYYGPTSDINNINTYLKLSLPNATNRNWNYSIISASADAFSATAVRNVTGYSRTWTITESTEASCSGDFCK